MKLSALLSSCKISELVGNTEQDITGICFDSRKVSASSMFIATVGTVVDGHQFITSAIEKGASVIVCEKLPKKLDATVTYVVVDNSSRAMGLIAAAYYQHPSKKLKLVGVTGTNGKTTVATLLSNLFQELGYKVGLLSTVENKINNTVIPSSHTTPDSITINELLLDMIAANCDYCFMEVSSHATVQERIAGLSFTGGIFTNITHDHLDFHHTFEEYIIAKKYFFDQLPASAFELTNSDDKRGAVMLQNTKAHAKTYALQSMATFKAKIIENQFSGLFLNIDAEEVWFKMVGSFNAYNLLAVYATSVLLGEDKTIVLTSLSALSSVEGRFQYVKSKNGIVGIVDYAHTPDALENVLGTINGIRTGNETLITIVGCGGDRDAAKRPLMATIACEKSDKVILTSDNPRSEDPEEIITQMKKGVDAVNYKKTLAILDRKEAIRTAVAMANPGDIILVAGKGHEKYQEIKGVKHPFDDLEILDENLKSIQG